MVYSLGELKEKEVINLNNGEKLGFVDDIEFESETGRVVDFIIMGRSRFMGLFGREDDIVLSCSDIELIGKDTILVRYDDKNAVNGASVSRKKYIFENLFEKSQK